MRAETVGGLGHALGSGVEEEDEVSGFDGPEGAVAGEEVLSSCICEVY
jgi:hypothetical protein